MLCERVYCLLNSSIRTSNEVRTGTNSCHLCASSWKSTPNFIWSDPYLKLLQPGLFHHKVRRSPEASVTVDCAEIICQVVCMAGLTCLHSLHFKKLGARKREPVWGIDSESSISRLWGDFDLSTHHCTATCFLGQLVKKRSAPKTVASHCYVTAITCAKPHLELDIQYKPKLKNVNVR